MPDDDLKALMERAICQCPEGQSWHMADCPVQTYGPAVLSALREADEKGYKRGWNEAWEAYEHGPL